MSNAVANFMIDRIVQGREYIYQANQKNQALVKARINFHIESIRTEWQKYVAGEEYFYDEKAYKFKLIKDLANSESADVLHHKDLQKISESDKVLCCRAFIQIFNERLIKDLSGSPYHYAWYKCGDVSSHSMEAYDYLNGKLYTSSEKQKAFDKASKLESHPHAALIKQFPQELVFPGLIKLFHKILNNQMLPAYEKSWKKQKADSDLKLLTEELGIDKLPSDLELRNQLVAYAGKLRDINNKTKELTVEITEDQAKLIIAEASELDATRGTRETKASLTTVIQLINDQIDNAGIRKFDACSYPDLAFLGAKDQIAFRSKKDQKDSKKEPRDLVKLYAFVTRFRTVKFRTDLVALHAEAQSNLAWFKQNHSTVVLKDIPAIPAPYVPPARVVEEEDVKAQVDAAHSEPQQASANPEPRDAVNAADTSSDNLNQVRQSPPQATVTPKPSANAPTASASALTKKPAEAPKSNEEPQTPSEEVVNANNAPAEPKKVSSWASFCNWLCSIPTSIWNVIKGLFN